MNTLMNNIFLFTPQDLKYILKWKLFTTPLNQTSHHATPNQKTCFAFLNKSGRSFSAVIQDLHPELLLPVAIFYLALRGLDTIEDDPSIPLTMKEDLLCGFTDTMDIDGWTFNGNRPEEKDREVLVRFDVVIAEYHALKPVYRGVIKSTVHKMGNGMADYIQSSPDTVPSTGTKAGIQTTTAYDDYCFYVAGLVGEGLTQLFVAADLASPDLLVHSALQKSMGLLLQKTNIIRDIRADFEDGRRFWPVEIWGRHVADFSDLFRSAPRYRQAAMNCTAEMVLNALRHVEECLAYLDKLDDESVFVFCAAPQMMALATMALCFRNPDLFDAGKPLKTGKGEACRVMVEARLGMRGVCEAFGRYIRCIKDKNVSEDPCFDEIEEVCAAIEKAIEALMGREIVKQRAVGNYLLLSLAAIVIAFMVMAMLHK
ncbi:isoprenoid synthase domain-containing protein [Aspergillus unguis]